MFLREKILLLQFRDLKLTKTELFHCLQKSEYFREFIYNKDGVESKLYEPKAEEMFNIPISIDNIIKLLRSFQENKIRTEDMIEWCDFVRFSNVFCYPEEPVEQELVANLIDEIQNIGNRKGAFLHKYVTEWISVCKDYNTGSGT